MDHGFVVLNYAEYRKKDYTNSERQRRFREKKGQKSNGVTSLRNGKTLRVTHAEAEAEADSTKESHPKEHIKEETLGKESEENQSFELISDPPSKKQKSPAMSREVVEQLASNPAYNGIDVRKEAWKFKNYCDANNKNHSVRRFVNWLNRAI